VSGWIGGLQVRRTERGQTPIADHLCTTCWHHRRVSGRAKVEDFMRSRPDLQHRAECPGPKTT
jgi:hypothetical protein